MTQTHATPILVFGALVLAAACSSNKADIALSTSKEDALKPQAVEASEATLKDRQPVVVTTGTLVPRRHAQLRALVDGRVDDVPVDIGTRVRQGQTLLQVRSADYENALRQAEASLARARAGLADRDRERTRMDGLFKEGSATEQARDQAATAYEEAQAGLKEAEAGLAIAKQALEDSTVRAPYEGVITMRNRQRGEYVNKGDIVVEIMDLSVLEAEMEVPEPSAGRITPGLPVALDIRGGSNDLTGKVVAVNPKIDTATRTFKVKVQVENSNLALQAGLFCTAHFTLPVEHGRIAIPASALDKDEGHATVWVIADGKVRQRPVVVDGAQDGFIFVEEGLKAGERVVSGGGGGLFDGAPVDVQAAPSPPASAS
jgi:membrane fusion protein, multidrug efflux system